MAYRLDRQRYETLRSTLWSERATFDADYRELADYFVPWRSRFQLTDRNKGGRLNRNIIDSTGTTAVRTLQSGMHAGLTSPARPWLRLTTPDPDLAEQPDVKQWLHTVTQRMLTVFLQSNLYNALPVVYGDMGVFATAAMGVVADPNDLFRCYVYPVGSYALGVDARGLVSTFVRDYPMTVEQLVEEFGGEDGQPLRRGEQPDWSHFSRNVKNMWDRSNYQAVVDVTWIVHPNRQADPRRLRAVEALPFTSCHFEKAGDTNVVLRESGYKQFPILAPRWDVIGEDTYGKNSPGIMAIGDVKQLQVMSRREGQAIEKMVNPPVTGPSSLRNQKVSLLPGDMTYDDSPQGRGVKPIHEVKPDLAAFMASKQEVQYRINRAFFADLFLMLAQSDGSRGMQPLTAREIDERHEEKLLALGPVLERTNDELLDPLVDRVFALMLDAGLLPPPPDDLDGVDLRVEYTSLMAQAQKLVSVAGHDRFVQSVLGMAQAVPDVLDKVNFHQVVDDYGDMLGVNPKVIRSDEDAQAMAQARSQAMQQQAMGEQMAQGAKAAKDLSATPLTGDTALNALVQAAS